ncbi:hypothetical protein LCGC14_2810150 [marine sediment metagenome]|uniref:Uncharacterized protein n=1 Tax=marine sediment metagenome TaxID=412755 RepID=A0A0F9BBE0_9ZZZZ
MVGREVFDHHSGTSKRGVEHHSYKHGRHSKYLPYPFADVYKDTQGDEQLLSVRDEIALSDAMIMSLLPALETGESGDAWKSISKLLPHLERAYQDTDAIGMAQGLRAMRAITSKQVAHYDAYDAINKQADHRRKLVETEQRISLQGERAISVELFAQLMSQIFHVIETIVKDKDERIAVAAEVRQFITAGN